MSVQVYGKQGSVSIKKDPVAITSKIYGLSYPIGQDTNGGYFSKQSGITLVRNNLLQLLKTVKGERIMLPDYGTNLIHYLFEPLDKETFNSVKNSIVEALQKYAPGVQLIKLSIFPNDTITFEGLQGMNIQLIVHLKELDNQTIDLQVTIG